MFRICIVALVAIACVGFGAQNVPQSAEAGPVMNLIQRIRENSQARRQARQETRAERRAMASGDCSACAAACSPQPCAANNCSAACAANGQYACMGNECDAVAAQAFRQSMAESRASQEVVYVEDAPAIPLPQARLGAAAPSDTVQAPGDNRGLQDRVKRLTLRQRAAFKILENRPDLRKAVAKYAEARGYAKIDPNNLAQILDVLLAFFEKILPLILTLF
jgi:hypothetical protein